MRDVIHTYMMHHICILYINQYNISYILGKQEDLLGPQLRAGRGRRPEKALGIHGFIHETIIYFSNDP